MGWIFGGNRYHLCHMKNCVLAVSILSLAFIMQGCLVMDEEAQGGGEEKYKGCLENCTVRMIEAAKTSCAKQENEQGVLACIKDNDAYSAGECSSFCGLDIKKTMDAAKTAAMGVSPTEAPAQLDQVNPVMKDAIHNSLTSGYHFSHI